MFVEIYLKTLNIIDSSRNMLEYLSGGLTRSRIRTFAFVTFVPHTCIG